MRFVRHHRVAEREARAVVSTWSWRGGWQAALLVALSLAAGCDTDGAGARTDVDAEAEPGAAPPAGDPALADDAAKASYSLGYRFAENVQRQFPGDIESESFVRGVRDVLSGKDAAVEDAEAERVLTAMMEARQAKAANQALETLEEGLAFLEKNAEREEVTTLESGLQYEVLEEGEGEKPSASDTVTTHYEGRLIDGTVFDSSYQRGEPATFPLNRVIAGWTEGVQLMSTGAKYRLYVPADLAYGDQGAGSIPPNSTLVFDVELLEIGEPGPPPGAEQSQETPEQ